MPTPPSLIPSNPSTNFAFFDYPATVVTSNMAIMNARADEMLALAEDVIAALGRVELPTDSPQPEKFVMPDIKMPSATAPSKPIEGASLFGEMPEFFDPGWEDVGAASGVDGSLLLHPTAFTNTIGVPVFYTGPNVSIDGEPIAPTLYTPSFPDTPDSTAPTTPELVNVDPGDFAGVTAPSDPSLLTIALPGAPSITLPAVPTLVDINVPVFAGYTAPTVPTLVPIGVDPFSGIVEPTINDVEPVFTGTEPNGIIYTEPTYSDALLDATKALVLDWYQGGTGLPEPIQQALFDAARSREEQTALATTQEAMDTWASRNFSMPPGMLVEAVTVAQERSRFAANELERQILIKSQEWEIENLRHAVAQGVALETLLIDKFNKMAQRTFEVARTQSEIEVKIYDVAVALYNAQQAARQIGATIYRAKWDGEVAKVSAYKSTVDAEVAKGQLNDQLTRVYIGQWTGVQASVDAYKATVEAERTKSSINESFVSVYRGELEGQQTIAGIYKTEVDAQGVVAQINEQFVNLFKAQWEGESIKAQSYRATVEGAQAKAAINDQRIRVYLGLWEGLKNATAIYTSTIQAEQAKADTSKLAIDAYGTGMRAFSEKMQVRKIPHERWVEAMHIEASKAGALDAMARSYAETVRAQENEANVKIKYIDLKVASSRASTEKYVAKLQSLRDFLHAQLDTIQARATTYQADTGRYRAEIEGKNMQLAKDVQVSEMRLQNDLAYYSTQLREFDAVLNRQIERGKIIVEALKSAGQISSALGAGAMSAIHVQSAIHGSGGVQDNNNYSRNVSQIGAAQYNWDGLAPPIAPPPYIP